MVKTRPKASNAGSANQPAAHPARKRRASNISSQRNPAPRAKRFRSDTEQLNAENEAATQANEEEEEEDSEHEQDGQSHKNKIERTSPAEGMPSSPPLQYHSTTLTQQIAQTTIQSTPLAPRPTKRAVRGRQSMPAQLGGLSSEVEFHQFTPFAETLDARRIRRLSRNHLSEEQNAYTTRLHELQKQLRTANERIDEVEMGREEDRLMGTANTLDDEKDKLIGQLMREKAKLEDDLAEHEDARPDNDDGGGIIDHDDMDMDTQDFNLHGESVVARPTNGDSLALTAPHSHRPDHASCRAVISGYQEQLVSAEVAIAKLTAEAEGIRIQMQNLGFTTDDDRVLSIVAAVHEAFVNARTELTDLDLLSEECYPNLADGDILPLMLSLLRAFQQQMAELRLRETELNDEIIGLNETVETRDSLIATIDRETDGLRRDNLELKEESDKSQTEVDALKEKLKNAMEEFQHDLLALQTEQEKKLSDMVEELDRAETSRQELEIEKNEEIANLKARLEEALEADEEAGQQLEAAGIDTDVLREGILQLRRERDAQHRQREQAENSLDEAQATIDRLEPQLTEANGKIGALEHEKGKLMLDLFNHQKQKEDAIEARDKAIVEHKAAVAKLQAGHQTSMDEEVSLRESTIAGMDRIIAEEREAGEKLGRHADSLAQEKQQLEDQIQTAAERNDDLDGKNHQLRSNIADLEAQIRALNTSIEEHESTIEQREATIHALNTAIEERDATIQQHAATIQGHENTIRQHEGTIRDRNATIEGHEATIREYTEKINLLGTEVNTKEGVVEDYEDDLEQLKGKFAKSESDNRQLRTELALAMTKLHEHATQTSFDFEQLSQRVSQHGITFEMHDGEGHLSEAAEELDEELDDEEVDDENPDENVETAVTETQTAVMEAQTTGTTKVNQSYYNLRRNKMQRDSGVAMMSSSPTRPEMFENGEE